MKQVRTSKAKQITKDNQNTKRRLEIENNINEQAALRIKVKKEEWSYRGFDIVETQLLKSYFKNGGQVTQIQ